MAFAITTVKGLAVYLSNQSPLHMALIKYTASGFASSFSLCNEPTLVWQYAASVGAVYQLLVLMWSAPKGHSSEAHNKSDTMEEKAKVIVKVLRDGLYGRLEKRFLIRKPSS